MNVAVTTVKSSAAADVSATADPPSDAAGGARRVVPDSVRRRLESMPAWTLWSWVVTAGIALIAGVLRFVNLGLPNELVFDEVYYATEGQELLDHGIEWRQLTNDAGEVTYEYGDFVAHPPLGKWIIAIGIKLGHWLGTTDAFGWRIMLAVCGIISIIVMTRTARRMFRSTVLGATVGLLMALDGMHFVLSRIAILDLFVLFFVVLAFGCLIMDRDTRRTRWLTLIDNGLDPTAHGKAARPTFSWASIPWWRLAMGVMLGAGCAVKWSVVFYLPVFVLLAFYWEINLRKTIGARHPWRDTFLDETGWFALTTIATIAAYLASWTGWFISDNGWKRHYLANELGERELPILGPLYNLLAYHKDVLAFHEGLTSSHPYQSWPWQWLILGRPIAFYRNGDPRCGEAHCNAEILLLGTPVLWWAFLPALAGLLWFGFTRRDWRALAIFAGAFAGIAPWFYYQHLQRTMYYFYAAPAEPFLVLAVVYCLGALINGPGVGREHHGKVRQQFSLPHQDRRLYGTIFAATFVVLVALCFAWYYPLYVGNSIPNAEWVKRMLLGNRWI